MSAFIPDHSGFLGFRSLGQSAGQRESATGKPGLAQRSEQSPGLHGDEMPAQRRVHNRAQIT